jgi:nucleolar protein 9
MLLDPFASHIVRALFILLDPTLSKLADEQSSAIRSKRSAGFKAKQGAMLSVFDSEAGKMHHRRVPDVFHSTAKQMLSNIRQALSPTEIRALAANKVAAPTLQVHIYHAVIYSY